MQQLEGTTLEPPIADTMEGLSLQEFLSVMRRRRLIVLQSFVIITVVAIVWTFLTKPVYEASARLLVEASAPNFINMTDPSNPFSEILALTQPQSVDTQVEVISSPSLLKRVKQEIGLARFNIKAVSDTNVIEVTADAATPELAADASNGLLRFYIDEDVNRSQHEVAKAIVFAQQQELGARQRLATSEAELRAFKLQHHVAELQTDRAKEVDQIATMTVNLGQAKAQLAALQAGINEMRRELKAQPPTITDNVQTTNKNIDLLQQRLGDLDQQRDALTQPGGFMPSAPQVRAVDAQIANVKRRLGKEQDLFDTKTITPNPRVKELQAKIEDLVAQEAAQKSQVSTSSAQIIQAREDVSHYPTWEVTVDNLTRQHDAAADLDKMLTSKIADLSLREQAHHENAVISEVAQPPLYPVRPNKPLNIILGALLGLFLGVCLAMLQEYLDDRINTVDDANRVLGLPSLGYVPALSATDAKLLPKMQSRDPAAESYRLLRTNVQFAAIDTPLRTLLVTSTEPGEGKSTTAANLAFAMALDGKKVLLVDTDLRRPSLHKLLQLPSVPGLTDVLLGRVTLEDTILPIQNLPNLRALMAGSTPPNPAELLNSHAFEALMTKMAEQNDIVIFDSPPLLVAADAALMASKIDGTVLVVAIGDSKKGPGRQAISLLRKGRANVLGIAFNKMRAMDGHGYYYYYNYGTGPLEDVVGPLDGGDEALDGARQLTAEAVAAEGNKE